MPLTRAAVENELVLKLRGKLQTRFWTLSIATDGTNPDLNGPMRRAVRGMGYETSDPLTVADVDFAVFVTLPGWNIEKLLDWARLETLKVCRDQFIDVNVQAGVDRQDLGTLASQIGDEIAYLEQRISEPYGPSINPAVLGVMSGGNANSINGMPNDPFQPCGTRSARGHWPYQ